MRELPLQTRRARKDLELQPRQTLRVGCQEMRLLTLCAAIVYEVSQHWTPTRAVIRPHPCNLDQNGIVRKPSLEQTLARLSARAAASGDRTGGACGRLRSRRGRAAPRQEQSRAG